MIPNQKPNHQGDLYDIARLLRNKSRSQAQNQGDSKHFKGVPPMENKSNSFDTKNTRKHRGKSGRQRSLKPLADYALLDRSEKERLHQVAAQTKAKAEGGRHE